MPQAKEKAMKRLYLTIDDRLAKRKDAVCKHHKLTWLDVIELGVEAAEDALREGKKKAEECLSK